MTGFEWREDVLRSTRTRLFEDIARTTELGYDSEAREALVVRAPYIIRVGDVLKVRPHVSLWRRLLGLVSVRVAWGLSDAPIELMLVKHAGATFTWVERAWGGTRRQPWRKGDHVEVIGMV